MKIVELKGVCKSYPAFRLREVSFSLEGGRITGFIGRNGAGKTTTIKSMLNLIHTDSGEITYFGLPLKGHEAQIKQRIGYSTGTVSWYPRKTIRRSPRSRQASIPAGMRRPAGSIWSSSDWTRARSPWSSRKG